MTNGAARQRVFAVTAPGFEPLAHAELAALGIAATERPGGLEWEGTLEEVYAANLHLRTASRLLLRVAEFRARTFFELERHARRAEWQRWLAPGAALALRVGSRKSKLYHEGAIAERLLEAIDRAIGPLPPPDAAAAATGGDEDEDTDAGAQLVVVRFLHDRCTVSIDSSGALLHRRGYRQALAKAPLRETIAAAMLMASGWAARRPAGPLVDPFCGSGTLPIEAALIARKIAPGLASRDRTPRTYAFERWPGFERAAWERLVERATEEMLDASPVEIRGSDRDAGAVAAAQANAERAGVLGDVQLAVAPLSALEPPAGRGWLITNPPYGVRVGEQRPLRNLYAALGRLARRTLPGWTVALLSAEPRLDAQLRLRLRTVLHTRNGGIPVRLVAAEVPSGA